MPLLNHDGEAVSEDICHDQGYAHLNCTDVFRQPRDVNKHGDNYPQCTNYEHWATEAPSMQPEDEAICDGVYEAKVDEVAAAADGAVDLIYYGRAWEIS